MQIDLRRKLAATSVVAIVVVITLSLSACGNFFVSNDATDKVNLSATALVLSSNSGTGTGVESKALSATAVSVGGSSSDVTSTATWSSSNPAVATVSANGTVTAVAAGTATISAAFQGATGTATVIVVASSVGTLSVTPASVTLHTSSGPVKQQLTATLALGSGTVDVTQYATWSSDTTTVATVDSSGVVTGIANTGSIFGGASTAKVTATILGASGQISASSTISVDSL